MRRFLCRQATHPAAEKCLSALKRAVAEKQVTWLPCEAIMTGDGWNSTKNGNGMGMVYHWVYHVLVTWLVGYSPKWSNMISKPKNEPDKLYIVLPSGVVYKAWQFNIDRLIGCFFWCLYIPKYTHVMSAGGQVTHACVNHEMNAGECVYHVWQDMFHRQWLNMDGCTKDCSLNIIPSLTSIEHNSAPKMAGWTSKLTKHSSSEVLKFQHQGLPTSPICRACRGCALPHQPGWFIPSRESPNMAGTSTEIGSGWFSRDRKKSSISFHLKKIWISAWRSAFPILGPFRHRESMGIPICRGLVGRIRKKSFGSAMLRSWRNWPNSPGQRRPRCRDGWIPMVMDVFSTCFLRFFEFVKSWCVWIIL